MAVDDRPGGGRLSAVDPDKINELAKVMERHGHDLVHAARQVQRELEDLGLPPGTARTISRIGRWMIEQPPELNRRRDLALRTDHTSLGHHAGLIDVDADKLDRTPAQSRAAGGSLAKKLEEADKGYKSNDLGDLLDQLATNSGDPQYTAAFFAKLGPHRAARLNHWLHEAEPGRADRDMRTVGEAFGNAVSYGRDVPGFDTVKSALTDGATSEPDRRGLAALTCSGDFPAPWLATVATVNVDLGDGTSVPDFQLNQRCLHALANNPAAARRYFHGLTKSATPWKPVLPGEPDPRPDLHTLLQRMLGKVRHDTPTTQHEFARALAAASGADDETDGHHSPEAARFSFTVMTTFAHDDLPAPMRRAMSRIAGSYASEMTEGANYDGHNGDAPSGFARPDHVNVPGLHPQFQLSAADTYGFMKTFADSDADMKPFNTGMGELVRRLEADGTTIEIDRNKTDNIHEPGMNRIMQTLGNVAGFQLAAEKSVRGKLDAADKRDQRIMQEIFGVGEDVGGLALPAALPASVIWTAFCHLSQDSIGSMKSPDRVGKVDSHADQVTLAAVWSTADTMMRDGYPVTVPPPATISKNGHLLPYAQLAKAGKLPQFRAWLRSNGMGGNDERAFGQVSVNFAGTFGGKRDFAEQHAHHTFDN